MSATADQVSKLAAWENRENSAYRVLPYGALAVSAALATFVDPPPAPTLIVTLAITALAGVWIFWFLVLHPAWASRPRLMAIYYAGLLMFAAVLVLRSPWYGFFAWVGFPHAFLTLSGPWRLAGVVATAVIVATSQSGGPPRSARDIPLYAVILLFNVGVAGALTWFGSVSEQQNNNRKRLIAELAEANEKLATTVRENVGLHAQLLTQAREAGVLDERQRMAREIHDTLAQGLTGIITQLEAAEQARGRRADWQRHVDTAVTLARESLSEARRSVRAVQPEPLEVARLPDALADLVDRWSAINGISAGITTTGMVRRMHPEIEVTLLRTAQEALANVAKHAGASRVGLTLSYMEDLVTLDVRDDGVGFEPALVPIRQPTLGAAGGAGEGGTSGTAGAAGTAGGGHEDRQAGEDGSRRERGGFGLTAMRQRVDRVAGHLEIESEPGGGTAISASVPAIAGAAG